MATAQLAAVPIAPGSAPIAAVGAVVVDAVPEPVKDFAIRAFGVHDKLVLLLGIGTALLIAAAVVGVLSRRRVSFGYMALAVLGGAGAAAALSRPTAGLAWAVPSVAGAAVGAAVLWLLFRRPTSDDSPAGTNRRPPRGPGGTGGSGADRGGRMAARRHRGHRGRPGGRPAPRSDLERSRRDRARRRRPHPYITANDDFYRVDTALVLPRLAPDDYRLRVTGRVANPLELTYGDLLDRGLIEREITLSCVSVQVGGNLSGNARWLGVPLKDLIEEADPDPDADQVVGRSADGWTAGTPTEVCTDGRDAMLAVGMNGEPLPLEHGFPSGCWCRACTGTSRPRNGSSSSNCPRSRTSTPTGCAATGPPKHRSRRSPASTRPSR
ncbi:hypothetical protein GCM10029992_54380 [Glycomyces albus]